MQKMSISRILLVLGGIVAFIIIFVLLLNRQSPEQVGIKKLKVTTSFYPLFFLAKAIGGELVIAKNLTPVGAEPHDFEPSTRDVAELEKQDIILLNGGGMEGYTNKIQANIDTKKTSIILVGQPLMNNVKDTHIWLDPILFKKEAETITKAFISKDPLHEKRYTENMRRIVQELDVLDVEFREGLRICSQKDIITSHNAFNYLAARYGLRQIALSGLSPEQEPSSKTLAQVAAFAKEKKIGYIFFEELVNPAIADTIAQEVGAKTLVLSPLEGLTKDSEAAGKTYFSIQKENLKNLQIALGCQYP